MSRLNPEKLHLRLKAPPVGEGHVAPRCYTLTHSDSTGELFLTIGGEYDLGQIGGWYTRLMRDEVLAEWVEDAEGSSLHVHCHVGGGLVFGSAGWRESIFRRELPLVLETLRYGDGSLFEARPALDQAPIYVHFRGGSGAQDRIEHWGVPADYRLTPRMDRGEEERRV
jgi:hypothetical protein